VPRRLSPIVAVFLTVFLDMLSFGLVIPDIQLRGDELGAHGFVRGLLIATFSLAQLLTAPFLGRLSDTLGRRKILLVSTILATVSFLFYAHADVLWAMFVARVLAGVAGANLGVAYAYIADVTTPEERARGMGLIGAAFGLGFVLGPVIGAYLVQLGGGKPLVMGYVAAGLGFVNFLFVLFLLPESVKAAVEAKARQSTLANLLIALRTPTFGLLLALFFVYNFAFSNLESTYFLLVVKHFGLTQQEGSYLLALVGVVSAVTQGALVRLAVKRWGEVRVVRAAYLVIAPMLAIVPFAPPWLPQIAGIVVMGLATGLAQPCLSSLISRAAPADMQGGSFGLTQALGACARILGPMIGNQLFDLAFWAPYALAGLLVCVPAFLSRSIRLPAAA